MQFNIDIDRTSSYIILSEMNTRELYVLQIVKENESNAAYFENLKINNKGIIFYVNCNVFYLFIYLLVMQIS